MGSSFRIKPSNSTSIADSVVFGYLGRHNRVKNIPRLIESFYLLKENYSNFKLLIAGFELDSECQYLRDIVSRLNLESHVFFVGFQERPLDFLSKLDFCVLSSDSEALPSVLIESMSLGIPCISTNVGDIQLIIGNTGFISSTLSSVSLYDQIILALSSLDQYDRLSLLSRSRISSLFLFLNIRNLC